MSFACSQQARRAAKPLLIVTGDLDPLFSADYYRENLIAALDDTVAFNYDWVRKVQGDHALSRYRQEVGIVLCQATVAQARLTNG